MIIVAAEGAAPIRAPAREERARLGPAETIILSQTPAKGWKFGEQLVHTSMFNFL